MVESQIIRLIETRLEILRVDPGRRKDATANSQIGVKKSKTQQNRAVILHDIKNVILHLFNQIKGIIIETFKIKIIIIIECDHRLSLSIKFVDYVNL